MEPKIRTREFPADCLPPEGEYESRDALFAAINAWAAPRGYAFTTGRSTRKKANGRPTVTYTCDRSGRPGAHRGKGDKPMEHKRQTSTRITGCQFSINAKQDPEGTQWRVKHRPGSQFAVHNHEPSPHISAHPSLRALSASDEATISDLTQASIAPRDIRTYLRQNSSSAGAATQQDIYNCIAKSKRALCEGQSTIQALANELDSQGFWSRIQLDQARRVTAVLFAHPESLAYLQAYPELLILDCTYKTNKYKMPLLDMIGVDACQRSFCIAFAFLSGEAEDDFIWALDRLRSMYDMCGASYPSVVLTDRCLACMNAVAQCFPVSISLLCLWHANKAVLAYCRPAFVRREDDEQSIEKWTEFFGYWFAIVNSIDEEAYNRQLDELERRYVPEYVDEVSYIKQTWLDLYKEKLVKAWVDQHAHFGNNVTSRVEGIHALLKGHLKSSQQDLFTAWNRIKQALLNQLAELRANQACQQVRTPLDLSGPLFSTIRGWVSHEALRKVDQQRRRLEGDIPACTGVFTRSQGLPCAHALRPLIEDCLPLQLHHFHSHWLLYRASENPELIIEPRRQFDTLTGRSASAHSSTRREPSLFEAAETARPKVKTAPTCSRCHTKGHTMTSRVCPLRHSELIQQVAARAKCVQTAETAQPTETTENAIIEGVAVTEKDAEAEHAVQYTPNAAIEEDAQFTEATRSAKILEAAPIEETAPIEEDAEYVPPTPRTTIVDAPATTEPLPPATAEEVAPAIEKLRYDDPRAIYERYVKARETWYKTQPRGSIKTNQAYRKAMGLPQRYDKQSFKWCLDYKQMSAHCVTSTGRRDWTKEEQMAYLDWSRAEDERVEDQVAKEMGDNPLANARKGMKEIWQRVEEDSREQDALHSVAGSADKCIFVKT